MNKKEVIAERNWLLMQFIESAASRETSIDILSAIIKVAGKNVNDLVRLWESPTETEAIAIWAEVTGNGRIDSTQFFWGAAGNRWAYDIGIIEA